MACCAFDFKALFDFSSFKGRLNAMKSKRRDYMICAFVEFLLYMIFATVSFIFLMVHHEALTSDYDDALLPSVIFLSSIIMGVLSRIVYFKPMLENFDNTEIEYKNWSSKLTGDSIVFKTFRYLLMVIGLGLWIAGWVFIGSSGGVDFSLFKEYYSSLAKMMLAFWIYITANTIWLIMLTNVCMVID